MSNRWLLISVIVLAIIVLALFLFELFSHKQTAVPTVSSNPFASALSGNESITDFTTTCYKTYISTYFASDSMSTEQLAQSAPSCFTTDFINQWPAIIKSTEGDPVLLAQDFYASWENTISASVASQTQTDATLILNMGTGTESRQLLVQLQMTSAGWRIASVSAPQ
ncbi:MAG: hypothetical protein P4M11_12755 [Candidatus Pacebacteria bacterium]|nr:hypothetical protein [Candidatus Paceibacterota bacterium]